MFRFIFSGTLENAVVVQALQWSMRDGACMMSCNSVNRNVFMWNQNTDNKSLMPGWSEFYGLRNDSPANACCRRCASLQKQECATPFRYCRGLEMALCLYVGKFSDMQNIKIYFHCFIYSLRSGSHLTTWTEIMWLWIAPTSNTRADILDLQFLVQENSLIIKPSIKLSHWIHSIQPYMIVYKNQREYMHVMWECFVLMIPNI